MVALESAAAIVLVTGLADLDDDGSKILQVAIEDAADVFPHVLASAVDRIRSNAGSPLASTFRLELRDAGGAVLASRTLTPDLSVHDGFPAFSFGESLPFSNDARSVALLRDDTLLDEHLLGGSPPTVQLLAPVRGDFGPGSAVRWLGHDLDGDPLSFTIQYSPDGGTTWEVLALDIPGASFTLPPNVRLAGGDDARIRIVARDGSRSARDTSVALRVPDAPPDVVISAPAPDATFARLGEPVVLSGFGDDSEDGIITDPAALTWISDRDGFLGNGDLVLGAGLDGGISVGEHTLTLVVKDSAGQTAPSQIKVLIVANVAEEVTERRVPLVDGWNLAAWTGATPVERATAGLAGLQAAFTYVPESATFLQYRPGVPPALNTLGELVRGDGVWLRLSGAAVWSQPDILAPRNVLLRPGFNLVAWTGPDAPITAALGDAIAGVVSVFTWDPDAQQFRSFRPGLPAALNTATDLQHAQAVWIEASEWAVWFQPAP